MANGNVGQAGFRTYIGLRYVPIIVGVWDSTREYEALSIVIYEGNSYTSKIPVPVGITLDNTDYWVMTGNYNVQVANLQNEVEVAVRQILDYATDFETFKQTMMTLYDNFVVDADGEVKEQVEEYERLLGEQYEAFIRYVNNVLSEFRNELDTFTEETTQRITEFINNTDTRIDNEFNTIKSDLTTQLGTFTTNTNQTLSNLQTQVDNLVVSAGNPESAGAAIEQAKGDYDTLADRLNDLNNLFLGYRYIPTTVESVDINELRDTGIYVAQSNISVTNAPITVPTGGRFSVIVRNCSRIAYQYGSFLTQCIEQIFTYTNETGKISKTWKRYGFIQVSSPFTPWVEEINGSNGIVFSTDSIVNFNTMPVQRVFYSDGYTEGNKPNHLPDDLDADTPYIVVCFGSQLGGKTQLLFTGTNNRVYVRNYILAWTDWDYLTTKDDVDSASATLNARIAEKLGSAYIDYNDLYSTGDTLADFEADIVTNVASYSKQVVRAKLTVGLDGVSTGVSQFVYAFVTYNASQIYVTFVDFAGHTYYDIYTRTPINTWAGVSTDYYTKAEVNALIQ